MSSLVGVGTLARSMVHRDWVRTIIPVGVLTALVYATAANLESLYPTDADLRNYADLIDGNAMMIVQSGPGYGLDDPTVGAVLVNELAIWTFVAVALMSIFAVTRHTRAEEESGRLELVRAGPVGHRAPLVAALLVVGTTSIVLGAAIALTLVGTGLPAAGSIALGAAIAACGIFFAALTTLAAQLTSHARGAVAIGAAAVAASFILRAVGDVGTAWLSWLSPMGWGHRVRPFADERWWVLLLSLGAAGALAIAGMYVAARRDFDSGVIGTRPGPVAASRYLSGPVGLVWRTQRASIIGWAVGVTVVGVFYGVVADEAEAMVADNPELEDFFVQAGGSTITEGFLSTALIVLALIVGAFAVSSTLRMRTSELAGQAEPLLAGPLSRWVWVGSHLLVTAAACATLLALGGAATGLGYALAGGPADEVGGLAAAAVVHAPATLVLAGATVLLFGVAPRFALGAWALVAGVVVVGLLGEALGLPGAARRLSPLEHSPALPADDLAVAPLLALGAIAALLTAIGAAAFRHRDAT